MPKNEKLTVRRALEDDLDDVADMVKDFVKGHPAEHHPRSSAALRDAYFGVQPVANLVVRSAMTRLSEWDSGF